MTRDRRKVGNVTWGTRGYGELGWGRVLRVLRPRPVPNKRYSHEADALDDANAPGAPCSGSRQKGLWYLRRGRPRACRGGDGKSVSSAPPPPPPLLRLRPPPCPPPPLPKPSSFPPSPQTFLIPCFCPSPHKDARRAQLHKEAAEGDTLSVATATRHRTAPQAPGPSSS
jgi:hypothetical protein